MNCTRRSLVFAALLSLLTLVKPARSQAAELPSWLEAKIKEAAAGPARLAPISIWQITHKGKLAYLFFAPCCDQYNPLYDASGEVLCHPSGGIHGRGDSTCPSPADRGTAVHFVWSHPQSPIKGQTIPALGQ